MSVLTVEGGRPLRGRLRVPGDKSISHRALLLAARAEGVSRVSGLSRGDDVYRTAEAVRAMGALVEAERITGGLDRLHEPDRVLDVGNSGTGIRLLAGYVAAFDWLTVLEGDESIARRPMAASPTRCGRWGPASTAAATAACPRSWCAAGISTASTTPCPCPAPR